MSYFGDCAYNPYMVYDIQNDKKNCELKWLDWYQRKLRAFRQLTPYSE